MRIAIVLLLVAAVIVPGVVFAQETDLSDTSRITITPASPFFFFKRITEDIGTFFAFGKQNKSERHLQLAERRLAEAEQLAAEGDEKAQEAVERYQKRVARAEALAESDDTGNIIEKVTERTSRHISTLERVLEKAPEQAQEAISTVIERAQDRQEELLERLEQIDPEKAARVGVQAFSQRVQDMKEQIIERRDNRVETIARDVEKWESFVERIRAEHEEVEDEVFDELDENMELFENLEPTSGDVPERYMEQLRNIKERAINTRTEAIRNVGDKDPERAAELIRTAEQRRVRGVINPGEGSTSGPNANTGYSTGTIDWKRPSPLPSTSIPDKVDSSDEEPTASPLKRFQQKMEAGPQGELRFNR